MPSLRRLTVDYDRDVLPLTPAGNATERHMLVAYLKAAARRFPDPVPFWAEKLALGARAGGRPDRGRRSNSRTRCGQS